LQGLIRYCTVQKRLHLQRNNVLRRSSALGIARTLRRTDEIQLYKQRFEGEFAPPHTAKRRILRGNEKPPLEQTKKPSCGKKSLLPPRPSCHFIIAPRPHCHSPTAPSRPSDHFRIAPRPSCRSTIAPRPPCHFTTASSATISPLYNGPATILSRSIDRSERARCTKIRPFDPTAAIQTGIPVVYQLYNSCIPVV
jgi:hypothetical protein